MLLLLIRGKETTPMTINEPQKRKDAYLVMQVDDICDDIVDELAIVGHHHQRLLVVVQVVLQPHNSGEILLGGTKHTKRETNIHRQGHDQSSIHTI